MERFLLDLLHMSVWQRLTCEMSLDSKKTDPLAFVSWHRIVNVTGLELFPRASILRKHCHVIALHCGKYTMHAYCGFLYEMQVVLVHCWFQRLWLSPLRLVIPPLYFSLCCQSHSVPFVRASSCLWPCAFVLRSHSSTRLFVCRIDWAGFDALSAVTTHKRLCFSWSMRLTEPKLLGSW